MPSPASITALMEHLQAGDHEAAQPLWERYYPRLVALARERLRGTFLRTFNLPKTVDAEHVSAEMKNGVLALTLPKKKESLPRQIKVNVA